MQLYISIVIPIFLLFFYLKKVEVDADSELSAASKASFLDKVRQSNQACQNGDFETAVGLYGEAIALDPCNHILFSNRSAALVKLGHFARALQDASRAVELNAKWPKVSLRVKSLQPALLQSIHLVLLFKHGALLFGSLYLDKEPRGGKTSSSFPPLRTQKLVFFSFSLKKTILCVSRSRRAVRLRAERCSPGDLHLFYSFFHYLSLYFLVKKKKRITSVCVVTRSTDLHFPIAAAFAWSSFRLIAPSREVFFPSTLSRTFLSIESENGWQRIGSPARQVQQRLIGEWCWRPPCWTERERRVL